MWALHINLAWSMVGLHLLWFASPHVLKHAVRGDIFDPVHIQNRSRATRAQVRALLGRREEALADYARAGDEDPSRAYPAIWIAGLGGGDERLRPFASGTQWISEVARHYVGRLTEAELLERAEQASDESTRLDQLCEAYGYIGLLAEREGDVTKALDSYRRCVETGVSNFIEHRWAKIRLEQEASRAPEKE